MEIDKELVERRFAASFDAYDELAHVQRRICERLFRRLDSVAGDVVRGFEIGAGTGFLTRRLVQRWPRARWFVNDLSPATERFVAPLNADTEYLVGDAETLIYPSDLELITSASTVQWFTDMASFARKATAALRVGGCLALSSFGPDNFHEIRTLTGGGLDYLTIDEFAAVFADAGLRVVHKEEWRETLEFDTPRDALKHIKSLGLNALSSGAGVRDLSAYPLTDSRATLTYNPIIVVAVK